MSGPTLKSRALHGSAWTVGGYGFSQVLRLASHLVLAWLLAPEVFGLMGLVMVFMHGLHLFSDFGIGPSVIQSKRGHDPAFLNTAWTLQIIRGIGLWCITLLVAKPFAAWYAQNDPAAAQLLYLLPVAAFSAVLDGFNSTKLFLLNREMQFARLTLVELGTQVVSLVVMISWALVHPTVWAMVAGFLAQALCRMVISHFLVPGAMVRLQWDHRCYRELFRFGKWIFLSTAFTFVATQADKVVLGKLLSLGELGLYGLALTFAMVAMEITAKIGNVVLFPVHVKFQNQPERLMEVALQAREAILWVGSAACICYAVGSPLFFETLWDPRYHRAGEIAQWLSLLIWARILLSTTDRIPLALGNSRVLFIANIIQSCGLLTAIIGYRFAEMEGFVVGLTAGPVAAYLFLAFYVPTKWLEMLQQSSRFTLLAGLVGALLVVGTLWVRENATPIIWVIVVIVSVTVVLMGAAYIVLRIMLESRKKD